MPTTLYLDPDDGIASIRSKLEAAEEDTLSIVVPYGLQALRNPVNVRLLKRHLRSYGLRATLVSRDEETAALARAEGLRVREGNGSMPAILAPEVVRNHKTFTAYLQERAARASRARVWKALGLLALGIALFMPLAGAWVFLPSATVTLRFAARPVDEVLLVTASSLATGLDAAGLRVPGQALQTRVEATAKLQIISLRRENEGKARGQVTFVNRSPDPVAVPAGARVATAADEVFLTQRAVSAPPNQASGVQVEVLADKPGVLGNVAARSITRLVDPALARALTVSNERPSEGGVDLGTVADQDLLQLRDRATALAREEGLRRLEQARPQDVSFFPETVRIRFTDEELDRKVGEETTEVTLKVTGTAQALGFLGRDVNEVLRRNLNQRDQGYELTDGPLGIRVLEAVRYDGDALAFHVGVKSALRPKLSEEQVKELVRGKGMDQAETLLFEQLALASRPQVETAPFWVESVPQFPWRITVRQLPAR
ncbi:MAG: baseplate J/gp47 family protein [Chloroflexi bacterium]|nr:baseplate J/gp47 family protein [Chloroflexota bacterium]